MSSALFEFLQDGGPVMIPIGLASVIGVAVFLERALALRSELICPQSFLKELHEILRQKRHLDALALCRKTQSVAAEIFVLAVAHRDLNREQIKERVEEAGRQIVTRMERNTVILGVIANVAPLLGLLGTVWGMILTFESIQQGGMGNISSLAGGISQALITTFAGLVVGIPAVIAHRWLLGKVDDHTLMLEKEALWVIDLLKSGADE